jgi:hypothetical protein
LGSVDDAFACGGRALVVVRPDAAAVLQWVDVGACGVGVWRRGRLLQDTNSTGPSVAVTDAGVVLGVDEAAATGRRIRVAAWDPAGPDTVLADDGALHHTPALVAVPGGVAVATYRNVGGLSNELWVASVAADGSATAAVTVPDAIAAPYASTITHVGGGVVFVACAQGDSPNFRVRGRFMATP